MSYFDLEIILRLRKNNLSRKEKNMIYLWVIFLAIVLVIKTIIEAPDEIKTCLHKEEACSEAALASKSCFEEEDEYPFPKGVKTPSQEFYRRLESFKAHGGVLNQHVCDRIADDISSEIKSMRGRRSDKDSEKIF